MTSKKQTHHRFSRPWLHIKRIVFPQRMNEITMKNLGFALLFLLGVSALSSEQADVYTTGDSCESDIAAASKNGTDALSSNTEDKNEEYYHGESSYTSPAPKMYVNLGADFGVRQSLDGKRSDEILDLLERTKEYMENKVMVDDAFDKVRSLCENKHESCAFWSVIGECEANPAYMKLNCAPVCQSCEMLHVETRCPMDPNATDALYPGDVNRMFERIMNTEEFERFDPSVISRPPKGPWMVVFENFLSDEEADRLIELGREQGYERSKDVGTEQSDGTFSKKEHSGRTSLNSWCIDECYSDPVAQRVAARIEHVTGIPEVNSENFQLLQYEKTQFYQVHSDYIGYQVDRPTGVRILTFYMYLNDVEEGGGTRFPKLKKTVTPKKGRAVLWPSVLDEDPNKKDGRTDHEAMPVIRGVKYGANAWIHQRDFKTNNKKGC